MTTVYVVMASVDYEGSNPIRAFQSAEQAEAFMAICRAYHETRPKCPPNEEGPENDALWEVYFDVNRKWNDAHPGGEHGSYADSFYVDDVPFGPFKATPHEQAPR